MRSLLILTIILFAFSLSIFSQDLKKCVFTYCQQDQNCADQAYPQLFCAFKKCPITNNSNNNLSSWYLCLQNQLLSCKISSQTANQAILYCFTNYNWNQDQINSSNYNDYLKIKPNLDRVSILLQNSVPLNQIQPCYQFPFQYNNCITQACQANTDCIKKNSNILQCALSQANETIDLDSWYQAFSKGFNSQTCKPQGTNIKYPSDFCFLKYNWNLDCINFQTQ